MISDPCLGWGAIAENPPSGCNDEDAEGGFPGKFLYNFRGERATLFLLRLLFPAIRFVIHGFDIGPAQNIFRAWIALDGVQQLDCLTVVAGGAIRMAAQPRRSAQQIVDFGSIETHSGALRPG